MESPGIDASHVDTALSKSVEDESELNLTEKLALSESDSEEPPGQVAKEAPDTDAVEFNEYGRELSPSRFNIDSDGYSSPEETSRTTSKKRVNQLVDSDDSDRGTAEAAPILAESAAKRFANLIDDDDSDDDVLPSKLVVSGSEDDETDRTKTDKNLLQKKDKPKKRAKPIVDNESSEAEPYERSSCSEDDDRAKKQVDRKKVKKLKKKSSSKTKSPVHSEGSELQNKLAGLCDESSEDEDYKAPEGSDNDDAPAPKLASERPPKRLTAREADEQMKIIQSESQRMAREASLSVPYHRPKQHSLKEFLNRHNVIRPVAQMDAPKAAAAIKMSKEQLEEYAKSLDERAKESQKFFKSESEEEEEEDVEESGKEPVNAEKDNESALSETVAEMPTTNKELTDIPTPIEDLVDAPCTDVDMYDAPVTEPLSVDPTTAPTSGLSQNEEIATEAILPQMLQEATPDSLTPDPIPTAQPVAIDYNFEDDAPKPASKLDLLKERVRAQLTPNSSSPSLKGSFDTIIDLDTGDVLPGINAGRDELFQRFLKHKAKPLKKTTQDLSVLTTVNGVVNVENIVMQTEETDEVIQDSKPRSAFFKLKEALGTKLAQKRRDEIMRRKADAEVLDKKNKADEEDEEEEEDSDEELDEESDDKEDADKSATEAPVVLDIDEDEELVTKEPVEDGHEELQDEEEDAQSEEGQHDDEDETTSKERRRIVVQPESEDEEDAPAISHTQLQKTTREIDDLLDICSDFKTSGLPESTSTNSDAMPTKGLYTQNVDEEEVSESQLVGLCSGAFFTQAPVTATGRMVAEEEKDEEEDAEKPKDDLPEPNAQAALLAFASSDEDEEGDQVYSTKIMRKNKKKTKKRVAVQLSDDDEDTEEDVEDEDEPEDDADVVIDYDSEENEIEVVQTKKESLKKANEFLEKEADLSESEWGSEDEDEKDMDQLDIELGDEDVFDDAQVHSELERIHMRRMRDADAREVKIIKDLLIEDEEDTGEGRERQFRWKNVNDTNWDDAPTADGETVLRDSDDENEEAWRKMRHERELMLKDTERSVTAADAIDAQQNESMAPSPLRLSTTLNSTATTTTRRRINIVKTAASTPPVNAKIDSPFLIGKASAVQNTRNSFLGRDEQTLARLAALSKPEVEGGAMSMVSKGCGNFVFSTLSPSVVEKKVAEKRKSDPSDSAEQVSKKTKSSGTATLSKGLMKKRLLDSLT